MSRRNNDYLDAKVYVGATVEIVVETTRDRALARHTVDALVIAARRRVDLLAMTTIVDALDHLDKSKQSSWIT
ncbi:hypothetical protein DdX_19439 [Ditylenchus destructor]|uniref:Uncharacterized protein n=1 Tax=Ditylenchus destructor TaxID=166010 RepID=A0AAD4MJ02_9BILA|nr:hypothetical protein DdX_19439 [Ditylenchus destructor]